MANINEILFIFHILAMLGMSGFRLYNIMTFGRVYDIKMTFIFFFTSLIVFFIGFAITMTDYLTIYHLVFKITTFLLIINVLFTFIEILMMMSGANQLVKAYNPNDEE